MVEVRMFMITSINNKTKEMTESSASVDADRSIATTTAHHSGYLCAKHQSLV